MSGGELNYAYHKVDEVLRDLQQLLDDKFRTEDGYLMLGEDSQYVYKVTKHNTMNLINKLVNARDLLKSLEFYLSGDNGFSTYQSEHREINLAFVDVMDRMPLSDNREGE